MIYIGKNAKAAAAVALKAGDGSGKAKTVVGGWVGDPQGKARRFWSLERPAWKFTCQIGVNLHVSGRDLEIDYGDGTSEKIGNQSGRYHIQHFFGDSDPHQVTLYGSLMFVRFIESNDEGWATSSLLTIDTPIPSNRILSAASICYGCASLTSIPAGLFDNCSAIQSFNAAFNGCTALANIPAGLFDRCSNAREFSSTFNGCTALANIPAGLFDNCRDARYFTATFQSCASLVSIPAGLFDNCHLAEDFRSVFASCTSLASVPPYLFNYVAGSTFRGAFGGCTSLTSIPNLFGYLDSGWDFSYIFTGCTSLTSIPGDLFDTCPVIEVISSAFYECTSLSSEVPRLWDATLYPHIREFSNCFYRCTNAANYADIPEGWR